MAKIAIVGAGSHVFAQRLITDLLTWPSLRDSTITLMDLDAERLELMSALARKMVRQSKAGATIEATTELRAALAGADYVKDIGELQGVGGCADGDRRRVQRQNLGQAPFEQVDLWSLADPTRLERLADRLNRFLRHERVEQNDIVARGRQQFHVVSVSLLAHGDGNVRTGCETLSAQLYHSRPEP